MLFDFICSLRPQTFLGVLAEQFLQQVSEDRVGDEVERWLLIANFIFNLFKPLILDEERRKACHHLEDQIPEGPPIRKSSQIHSSFPEDFRRQVLRRACDEVSIGEMIIMAAEAEVYNFDVSLGVYQYIFRLEAWYLNIYSR